MDLIRTLKNRSKIIEALTTLPWDLKPEQVKYLTKRHLLRFSPGEILYVWDHLPEKFQNDKDIQLRRPCYEHFNVPEDSVNFDGLPPAKADCYKCRRDLLCANSRVNFSYCCI